MLKIRIGNLSELQSIVFVIRGICENQCLRYSKADCKLSILQMIVIRIRIDMCSSE